MARENKMRPARQRESGALWAGPHRSKPADQRAAELLAHDLRVLREQSVLAAASQGTPPARRALNRIGRPVTELLPVPDSIRNYRQLAGHLRELISTGLLGAGDLLPSAAELARHLGLAKSTVHRAITALGQDGCIERVGNRWSVSRSVESEPDVMVGKA